jgi:NAD(P)H-dependent flavin oxidoreductase YrpB (nitropropane dioxygenase family)
MWKTRVTEMLGIKYPIIEGSFSGFGTSALAAPVSEAGGLGMITAHALRTAEGLREDIHRLKSKTDKPFAVNITMSLCPDIDKVVEVIIDEGVPVVETSVVRGDIVGKRLQAAGIKWIHKVATVRHALSVEAQGADAVVIVGLEGTGFKSPAQLPTLITIPWAVRQIKIPIIAAGGIGDSYGFMAALSMGAEAVYLGTAFMATKECPIPDRYKQKLVESTPADPEVRERVLSSPSVAEYEKLMKERETIPEREWLVKLERVAAKVPSDVSLTEESFYEPEEMLKVAPGSLAVAMIDKVVTVKELIENIISGAEAIRKRWSIS